ncbi:MAG: Lipoate-protein ligase A [Hydrogenibacillus schlegelii]|uniref:Lipoate-protein ligase A n=1 Tax=Hydrogenibacillus schlegelii TaxID=1484 RepID=A0A2T5GES4_HYDSH|nr:MAG: Lipoate-protein ligase A [Hydrogenibacillus schlegelii]
MVQDIGAGAGFAGERAAGDLLPAGKPSTWRLVVTDDRDPAFHMSLDEAMVELVRTGRVPPTLRLYTWRPRSLSLGMNQAVREAVDLEAVKALGVGLVRRPSGGRTVFHDREVTYSIVVPENDPRIPEGVMDAFRRLTEGLVAAFHALGLRTAELQTPEAAAPKSGSPVCFESPGAYELVIGGKKAAGSAQARLGGVLLQHGSVPLSYDEAAMFRLFYFPNEAAREQARERFRRTATAIEAELGRPVGVEALKAALVEGFSRALGIRFVPEPLTPEETALAERLVREKYGRPEWTFRR